MAKKKTAKKTARSPSGSKKKAAGRSSAPKAAPKKKTASKVAKKSSSSSRTSAKSGARSSAAGKKSTKKADTKPVKKKATESKKKPAPTTKKSPPKPAPKSAPAQTPAPAPAAPAASSAADSKGRKGITVVEKKRSTRAKAPSVQFPSGGALLAPGGPLRKPLIPSGPQNVIEEPLAGEADNGGHKSPFNKRQLEKFRGMLLDKRRELLGDITGLESEALKSADGADPRLAEHLEDQSSDAIDQAVSLDLAAADRRLLRMIDEALERIDQGTYGLCVMTGRPIREERLRELPWASLSIEAARAEERRQMGRI